MRWSWLGDRPGASSAKLLVVSCGGESRHLTQLVPRQAAVFEHCRDLREFHPRLGNPHMLGSVAAVEAKPGLEPVGHRLCPVVLPHLGHPVATNQLEDLPMNGCHRGQQLPDGIFSLLSGIAVNCFHSCTIRSKCDKNWPRLR